MHVFTPHRRQPRFIRQEAYAKYLESDHWKDLRRRKLAESGYQCRCGAREDLQVHHKCYRDSWYDTELFELEVLCRPCHQLEHTPKPKIAANSNPTTFNFRKRHGLSKRKRKIARAKFRSRVARYGYQF
jgi:5-methylcytosine-specific restriction endonuclease McrA